MYANQNCKEITCYKCLGCFASNLTPILKFLGTAIIVLSYIEFSKVDFDSFKSFGLCHLISKYLQGGSIDPIFLILHSFFMCMILFLFSQFFLSSFSFWQVFAPTACRQLSTCNDKVAKCVKMLGLAILGHYNSEFFGNSFFFILDQVKFF